MSLAISYHITEVVSLWKYILLKQNILSLWSRFDRKLSWSNSDEECPKSFLVDERNDPGSLNQLTWKKKIKKDSLLNRSAMECHTNAWSWFKCNDCQTESSNWRESSQGTS